MKLHSLALILTFGLSACAPTVSGAGSEAFELAGSEWGMVSGADMPFIQFGVDGKVTGNGSCNRFGGTYVQDGRNLSFGPLMSTKMACLELENETAFFNILESTRAFEGDHLQIVLKSEGGAELLTLQRRDWD